MFLTCVARPRFSRTGECIFDGKIGLFPFTEVVLAKRSSVNRKKGTPETRPVSVNRDIYKHFILTKVLPAIKEKWPCNHDPTVVVKIQQDNAPSHFEDADRDWQIEKSIDRRFKFELKYQPPNSPDCNVLDLGFFRSIQSIHQKTRGIKTVDDVVNSVLGAWEKYDPRTLNRIFLTHSICMDEIIRCYGGNHYSIPHINKEKLERERRLPEKWKVSQPTTWVISSLDLMNEVSL